MGKACKCGNEAEVWGGRCSECRRAYQRVWIKGKRARMNVEPVSEGVNGAVVENEGEAA